MIAPVGLPLESRKMAPPETPSGSGLMSWSTREDTQEACPSTRFSTINRPRSRGSRSRSTWGGRVGNNRGWKKRLWTNGCGKLRTLPSCLVPPYALDPARGIILHVRVRCDELPDAVYDVLLIVNTLCAVMKHNLTIDGCSTI